ncbi:hypothetical protein Tco_1218643 [Tanacetum coccineum]
MKPHQFTTTKQVHQTLAIDRLHNQIRYNAGQIVGNQVRQNVIQNSGIQNVRNKNGLSVVLKIANQNGNRNVVAARAVGNSNRNNEKQISVAHSGGTIQQHPPLVEETRAYFESLYNNLVSEVEKFNTVNRKMRETNVDLTTELARYKGQEKCFEFNQAKLDELKNSYRNSAKQIMTLNEEIANLNNQLSKEKSTVSYLQEERKKLKDDFKTYEDELLDKLIQYEKKIKELDNILAKSRDEVYFSNTSKIGNVSNTISIPDDEFSNDTSPCVAQKILNEVKDTIVTLQSVVKLRMNANINNWSSLAHQEFHKIIKDEIAPIVNQVDARVQNFKNHFMKEAAKFIRDFKSLAKEADESLDKITDLEKENERLL